MAGKVRSGDFFVNVPEVITKLAKARFMKYLNKLITLLSIIIFIASCKKDEIKTTSLSSLTAVNAVVDGNAMKLGSNATTINNNSSAQLALIAGENNLYLWPVSDSAKPYFTTNKFLTQNGEVHSLYVFGDTLNPQGMLVKETIPYRTDSTAGIRFINLSPNTADKALNISLASAPGENEVSNLAYKQYTQFKSYPSLYNSSYEFEIRNDTSAAPKTPLATFSLLSSEVPRFANITLVIHQAGTGLSIFRVNNDR